MKKFVLLGICGAMLAACDSGSSTGFQDWCVSDAVSDGVKPSETLNKLCGCVQEKIVKKHGAKEVKTFVEFMKERKANGLSSAEEKYPSFEYDEVRDDMDDLVEECAKTTGFNDFI